MFGVSCWSLTVLGLIFSISELVMLVVVLQMSSFHAYVSNLETEKREEMEKRVRIAEEGRVRLWAENTREEMMDWDERFTDWANQKRMHIETTHLRYVGWSKGHR